MPLIKMINDSYSNQNALHNVIDYIRRRSLIYDGLAVAPNDAEFQMQFVKEAFYKTEGRQIRHFIVAFSNSEDYDIDEIYTLAQKIALYYANKYQIILGIHMNTENAHIHFAFNTVSYIDGKMYREGYGDYIKLKAYISTLLHGASVSIMTEDSPIKI